MKMNFKIPTMNLLSFLLNSQSVLDDAVSDGYREELSQEPFYTGALLSSCLQLCDTPAEMSPAVSQHIFSAFGGKRMVTVIHSFLQAPWEDTVTHAVM